MTRKSSRSSFGAMIRLPLASFMLLKGFGSCPVVACDATALLFDTVSGIVLSPYVVFRDILVSMSAEWGWGMAVYP